MLSFFMLLHLSIYLFCNERYVSLNICSRVTGMSIYGISRLQLIQQRSLRKIEKYAQLSSHFTSGHTFLKISRQLEFFSKNCFQRFLKEFTKNISGGFQHICVSGKKALGFRVGEKYIFSHLVRDEITALRIAN